MDAVVLGGSHATNTAHAGSDIDIDIYYDENRLGLTALQTVATALVHHPDAANTPGNWGP